MSTTERLSLEEWEASQASPWLAVNEALKDLDFIVQCVVLDKDLTAPPGSPANGDMYIVADSATGDWAGQDGNIARYSTALSPDAWEFYAPFTNMIAFVNDEQTEYRYRNDFSPAAWEVNAGVAPINRQVGTSYTIDETDVDKVVEMNNASPNTVTLPASPGLKDGACIGVRQIGSGTTTIAAASGATINSPGSLTSLTAQHSFVMIQYDATADVYRLTGELS